MAIRVLVWNVEWARTRSGRGREIRRRIEEETADVVCVTEGFAEVLPESGHLIDSDPDYGYRVHEGRRKVLLWSREPWERVDRIGHSDLPAGRYAAGVTRTALGPVEVFGVCVPWQDAHVRSGRRDRRAWEDHSGYLRGLRAILADRGNGAPALVIGDFNQRIPRKRTPPTVYQQLLATFEERFSICTAGEIDGADSLAIDHVAHTGSLTCTGRRVIPKVSEEGLRLSDHFGLMVELGWSAPSGGDRPLPGWSGRGWSGLPPTA